jgi:hypothetical protein
MMTGPLTNCRVHPCAVESMSVTGSSTGSGSGWPAKAGPKPAAPQAVTSTWWLSGSAPRYRVEGRDMTVEVPVSGWEAVLGATVPVETPAGTAHVELPAAPPAGGGCGCAGGNCPTRVGSR